MSDKPVLVLSGERTTQLLVPHLVERFDLVVLSPAFGQSARQTYGNERIMLPFVDDLGEARSRASSEAILRTAPLLNGNLSRAAMQLKSDLGEFDWENRLRDWTPNQLVSAFSRQIMLIDYLDNLMSKRSVRGVVVHEDVTETFKSVVLWANARGVPSVHVPHAACFLNGQLGSDVHEFSVATHLAATPFMERFYRARGYSGEIRQTGSPLFDKTLAEKKQGAGLGRRALQLDAAQPVVVYATSWGQSTNANDGVNRMEAALDAMLTAVYENDWQLIIKVHPGEQPDIERLYAQRAVQHGINCLVTRLYPAYVLDAANVVVALGPSNYLVEAAIYGKPGVCVKMPNYSIQHAAIPEVEPIAEAVGAAVAKQLSAGEGWGGKEFVRDVAGNHLGNASQRAARWVSKLAEA